MCLSTDQENHQRIPSGKRLHNELENHHVSWENQLQMVIFNRYVTKLLEDSFGLFEERLPQ